MKNKWLLCCMLPLLAASCSTKQIIDSECPQHEVVTIAGIVDSGKQFDNQMIMISGVFNYEFEDVAIYNRRWFKQKEKALWVNFSKTAVDKYSEEHLNSLKNSRIEIIGILDLNSSGHLGQYLGEIELICILD